MKDAYPTHRGPLPPVVFREPDSGKLQLLPETPKKKNPTEQFIFQRRTPATAEPSGLVESSSLYVELGLTDSGTESDEEVSSEMSAQGQEEGQGGTNPGDTGMSQTPSSHVVHVGPNLDHMDLGITKASSQPNTKQMDDEFTANAYPKVQENLKLPSEGEVRLEEPTSSAGTLSSMKNLNKDLSFTDQFLVEKSQEDEPEKTNTEAEVQSMVTVPIHQDTSSVLLMTTPVIDITDPQSDSTTVPHLCLQQQQRSLKQQQQLFHHLSPKDKKILSTAINLWVRNLVIKKRVEDFQLDIKSYQTQLNLTKPRWEATGLEFMHDYKILDSPRAVLFREKYGMQMLMRFNEIYKFSDGTLQQIDEALEYQCKQFMFAIQKRLKLGIIFRNLESFVGRRIREGDYRLLQRTE
ncbi:hypothetical protein Tco_1535800, partial [Tanacetum coccineum]